MLERVHNLQEALFLAEPIANELDFLSVYDTWFRPVYRWVLALGGPVSDAEDLTQEVFIVVQRRLSSFDGKNLRGWLYRIAANTVSDRRNRSWFRRIFLGERVEDETQIALSGSELLEQKQEQQRFYRILESMNAKWRHAFVLFEVEGYSSEEIAELQAIPHATVRTHLRRARQQFLSLVAEAERMENS